MRALAFGVTVAITAHCDEFRGGLDLVRQAYTYLGADDQLALHYFASSHAFHSVRSIPCLVECLRETKNS